MPKTKMEPAVREQLEEAMLRELVENGREGVVLSDVLGGGGISEAEFAAEYTDIDACLDAGYERLTTRLDAAVRVGCATGGRVPALGTPGWASRVRAGLEAMLAELADRPTSAIALTRAYPSLGPSQQARYQTFVDSFATQLRKHREMGDTDGELPGEIDSLAVGAAEAIVFEEISAGRIEELPRMGPSILFSLLVPYLGGAGAVEEMKKARLGG